MQEPRGTKCVGGAAVGGSDGRSAVCTNGSNEHSGSSSSDSSVGVGGGGNDDDDDGGDDDDECPRYAHGERSRAGGGVKAGGDGPPRLDL